MSNTIRIKTTPNGNDKYLKVNLEQKFDFIEILSLKITQEDAYRRFCSDYGAIVGRVIMNSGFGVPNAKVSVFIPIDDIDKNDTTVKGLYPYEIVSDKDSDGIRYNLLPKQSETDNSCYTPIGTFPNKREVLDNEAMSYVYCKYYKFTTTTNYAGDFMLFGVPVGTYVIHVDADISDIGIASQRPYDLIRQGTPNKLFDSSTKFSKNTNLDKLPQVKTANVGVNVQPFWGDLENCQVGITRVDIDLNYNLVPAAIFMGSIFGDQDKDSVSKRCAPREDLGELCQQITNEGSIEILRKTPDNETEIYYVEGGRVIDENGTWAFQVPMNLDYVVTSEDGTLIPSSDKSQGIPTRASVRFRIGMDETGGEGRLRTRAKYLVPNNPQSESEIDYNFDDSTKDVSFRDMYWNKIYSISSFIPRYQKVKMNLPNTLTTVTSATGALGGNLVTETLDRASTRNFTGIKNVDDCVGDKTPFPYNRIKTKTNPLFSIICLIIKIISFLISFLNSIVIPLINVIVSALNTVIGAIENVINGIVDAINSLGFDLNGIEWAGIDYVPCVAIQCPTDNGAYFAPGCPNGSQGLITATNKLGAEPFHCQTGVCLGDTAGLDDCVALEMATALNLYQFDFYNDWINGTLYSFLLKYKYKRKGKERFCEYDCEDFGGGVDGNEDGDADNNCYNQILLDTLYPDTNNSQNVNYETGVIREGLIKKKDENLYYASTLHNVSQKLFATDIICLGSVFECDWQGFPKINQYLIPTSYKIPPSVSELSDDGNIVLETGIVELNSYGQIISSGLFFSINCAGIHVNERQALNIRHICEMFVDTDQNNEITNSSANGIIGEEDIDDDIGRDFRDVFLKLNSGVNTPNSYTDTSVDSRFNISNAGVYDFTSPIVNGNDYINFRGYPTYNTNSYTQPKHSYFMYFGLTPGKTAVDLINQNYFQTCAPAVKKTMVIQSETTADLNGTNDGSLIFTIIGGFGPYEYTINGPDGYALTGTINDEPTVEITGLGAGNYVIVVIDSLGNPVSQSVFVTGLTPLYSIVSVTQNDTSLNSQDGEITILSIGGGVGPYSFLVTDGLGNQIGTPSSGQITNLPMIIGGLGANTTNGYTVVITDSNGNTDTTDNLIMTGIEALTLTTDITPVTCYNGTDGIIEINVTGGVAPYTTTTTGPNGFSSIAQFLGALGVGSYVTNIVDGLGNSTTVTSVLSSLNPQITIQSATNVELAKQCDPLNHHVKFKITAGLTPNTIAYISYQLDSENFVNTTLPYVDANTMMELVIPKNSVSSFIRVKVSNSSSYECYSNQLTFTKASVEAPSNALNAFVSYNVNGTQDAITVSGGFPPFNLQVININNNNPYNYVSVINNGNTSTYTYNTLPVISQMAITVTDNVGCVITI